MQAGATPPAAWAPSALSDLQLENRNYSPAGWIGRAWARTGRAGGRPSPPLIYTRVETGRRPSYCRLLERLFGARRARLRDLFLSPAPVLFLRVEEGFLLYWLVCLVRAATGRRTAAG